MNRDNKVAGNCAREGCGKNMKKVSGANIAIIAAMAKNRVIGNHGRIPWDLPEDREHFKKLTMGQIIIMGRRSFQEIGTPLPGRITYVVSTTLRVEQGNCHPASSLVRAIGKARASSPKKKIFLCGGERIYEEGMALAQEIYLTVLDKEVKGDTYFPEMKESFHLVEKNAGERCTFLKYCI